MDVSGAVIRQSVGIRWNVSDESYPFSGKSRGGARQRASMATRRWSEESHSLYYASSPRCSAFRDVQIKEVKKIASAGTELSREFATLYSMGLGIEYEEVIGGKLRGEMIKETSELLLAQLNQKKAKEKEIKKKKKEEKTTLKSRKMRDYADESSSSSSSESSDSECEEVVETSKPTKNLEEVIDKSLDVPTDQSFECKQEEQFIESKTEEKIELNHSTTLKLDRMSNVAVPSCTSSVRVGVKPLDKIEVCMGGKCKKSGSIELLQELEKKVGIEGAVIGCKCMGKCKQGPNIRVLNRSSSLQENELVMKKPVSISVGLDDVGAIVADFLGQNDTKMGLLPA